MFSSYFPYLHFACVFIYSVPCIPIKSNCCHFVRVLGLVLPLGVCVSCVLLGLLLGRGFFMYLICWSRALLEGDFAVSVSFLF